MFWVLLTTLLSLTTALQWTDSLTNNTVITVCSASDIQLPWNFTLSPDERIEDIKWIYRAEDGSEGLIAIFAAGHFKPMPAFTGRVQWTGQGGIVVSQAAIAESGNYTVMVSTDDATHPLVTFSKTIYVHVADPPTAQSGEFHVLQEPDAVIDNTTGQWKVELTCGVLTSPGHPAVHVVWTTPDGHTVESSSEHNGTFRLLLPNPPSGGNYTCTLPPLSPATRCLPPLSPLLEGATVIVDQVKASFTLLEARQQEMEKNVSAENARLQTELDALKTRLDAASTRVSFHARLQSGLSNFRGRLQPFNIITNEGDAINGTTGIFTTPRDGTYFFVASSTTLSADKYVYMHLMAEGRSVAFTRARRYSNYGAAATCHATIHLTVGERVWVESGASDTYYGSDSTSFTGFLLGADDW
ncbi:uncharacterized protein [Littorina saxatilis]|uniref:Uncharacterized protein n=1 Tax=Littorina saxatilis TaxID=31220 RepID=A0AAN9FZV4_9CAEN